MTAETPAAAQTRNLLRRLLVSARRGVDHAEAAAAVYENGGLSGRYLMMTVISAAIAALGLMLSSPAVVIGAMLVSPMMGPIVALGFSLALLDWNELKQSLTALGVGVGLALFVAILLTLLSPLKEPTAEILARHPAQLLRPADRGLFRRGGRLRRDPTARRDHHRRGHRHRPDAARRDGGLRPGDRRPFDRGGRLLPVHDQPGGHRLGGDGDGGLLRLPAAPAGAAQAVARGGGHGGLRPAGRAAGPVAAQHRPGEPGHGRDPAGGRGHLRRRRVAHHPAGRAQRREGRDRLDPGQHAQAGG
ncbi:DUF389 domain-containing protein [Brevundimonas sp. 357]|nr:DUF389 domain-containing protein [Brevundimonas sp. 357]